ncbi:purine-cytosine permease family protein [Alkalihalophilus marmarensis]|uniref:purine-cytosine permease family protein n=1 Tax=Alkalihalophilus marmarensis TaxID=521377 RepID=UPI002DBB2D62|nr:cytosine permease [Alkalihalophilus marmarensis]
MGNVGQERESQTIHTSAKPLVEQYGLEAVPRELQTTKALQYTFIQMAVSVNAGNVLVPALAVTAGGLTFIQAVISTVIGAALAFLFVSFLSLPGAKYGIPAQYSLRAILGYKGARYVASPIRTLTSMYWFAVQTIGGAYLLKELILRSFNINVPFLLIALIVATIMAVLALIGFDAVKRAANYFLPFLFFGGLVMLYILVTSEVEGKNFSFLISGAERSYSFETVTMMLFFASLAFVQYISGVSAASDMARYAKSGKHAFTGLFIGNTGGFFLTAVLGAYTAALTGEVNPYVVSSQLTDSPIFLFLILVASIASMVMINISNAYTGGYSLLNSIPSLGRVRCALLFGACAVTLSAFPALVNEAQLYISYLGVFIIPLSAVIVADFLSLKKLTFEEEDFRKLAENSYRYNKSGLIVAALGAGIYIFIPDHWSPGFMTFIVTGLIYLFTAHYIHRKEVRHPITRVS